MALVSQRIILGDQALIMGGQIPALVPTRVFLPQAGRRLEAKWHVLELWSALIFFHSPHGICGA